MASREVFGGGISALGGSGHSLQSGTVGELGADLDNLDEVVTDVAVEADEVPRRAGSPLILTARIFLDQRGRTAMRA